MGAVPYTIPECIQIAKICRVLATEDIRTSTYYNGQPIDKRLPKMLFMEQRAVEWYNNHGSNSQYLNDMANYLLALCWPYLHKSLTVIGSIGAAAPVITGPSNQSVTAGNNATFSVSVIGSSPFSYQWYDTLGNLISGATGSSYTFLNAQLTDNGNTFFVKVTDSNGKSATSGVATLTVTAILEGFLSYGDIDPATALQSSTDPFTYQNTFSITHNASLSITIPVLASVNKFLIVKVPIGESTKNTWFNTALNNGTIPDFNWQAFVQFGGLTYYYTRQALSMDATQPLILSAV